MHGAGRVHRVFGRAVVAHAHGPGLGHVDEALATGGFESGHRLLIRLEPQALAVTQIGNDGNRQTIGADAPAAKHAARGARPGAAQQFATVAGECARGGLIGRRWSGFLDHAHTIIPNMARPKSAFHELKREEILNTAARCFAESSYPAASMNDIAAACGTSKARLYHYYESKEAILFDLLDRYTRGLLLLVAQVEATAQRRNLDDRAALHELIHCFLAEYQHSATRHVALLNSTKFLSAEAGPATAAGEPASSQREQILNRQRDVVSAVTRFLRRAYPERLNATNQTAITMMLFGMINWTFTWLRPDGPMRYGEFADEVIAMLERGLG